MWASQKILVFFEEKQESILLKGIVIYLWKYAVAQYIDLEFWKYG